MTREMSPELLEAMQGLDSEQWDEIVELWKEGEVRKTQFEEQYYKQLPNQNLGNRTFHEDKRLQTPEEYKTEIDNDIISAATLKSSKNIEQEQKNRSSQEPRELFSCVKNSLFRYNSLIDSNTPKVPNKDATDPDKFDDFE